MGVRTLQRLLAKRDHAGFLEAFCTPSMQAVARHNEYFRALAGEGLCLLLAEKGKPSPLLLDRYAELLRDGLVLAPSATVHSVAKRMRSHDLSELAEKLSRREHAMSSSRARPADAFPEQRPMIKVKRVIQSMHMLLGDAGVSDAQGVRQSVFRSQQERSFLRALALRFPALLALPNYPLDQIANLDRIRGRIDEEVWTYGCRCRLDAVLVVPDEGDPIAAFELDSGYHDAPAAAHRDHMKNRLFEIIGLPFFRLRVESPESMSMDEWYALLTDKVVPVLDVGRRLRCRSPTYSLVPA